VSIQMKLSMFRSHAIEACIWRTISYTHHKMDCDQDHQFEPSNPGSPQDTVVQIKA